MTNRRRHLRVAWTVIVVAGVLLLLSPGCVLATNDENHIAEVMAGANGNSQVQFIVIRQEGSGNFWGPQSGETQSRAMLVFFDATGRETGNFKFPSNPQSPVTSEPAANILIATQAFASLPGAPTPDFTIPPLLNPISGKVCFQNNPLNGLAFPRRDCLSYGSFSGSTGTSVPDGVVFGPPASALPIVNTVSLRRPNSDLVSGSTPNATFVTTATPTPRNSAGATFTIPVATQIAQGDTLFNNETFLGNGRSCGSCHVASENFRLPPSNIHARFATLSTTFDPQFVAETVPSGVVGSFDFNLNTLVLTAPVTSASPCTGELRGIITAPGGGRAKVLTRLEPTAPAATSTYLVYGGKNPSFVAGETVSDSFSCSGMVSSITAGTLGAIVGSGVNGLEDPTRMRMSASPELTEGRGLILENIDGFPPTPPVFRKSPHLLNLSRDGSVRVRWQHPGPADVRDGRRPAAFSADAGAEQRWIESGLPAAHGH